MKSISNCLVCGKEYIQKHKNHKYCSIDCKRKANPQVKPISVPCTNCGGEATFTRYNYERKKNSDKTIGFFCSKKCEGEYRTKIAQETRICEWCKQPFTCRQSDDLRFCSINCQHEWQKTIHTGKKHPSYKHDIPGELREKVCPVCGKTFRVKPSHFDKRVTCSKECINFSFTEPRKTIYSILEECGVSYIPEKRIRNYYVDAFLKETNLIIEANGDFWHTHPLLENDKRIRGWEKNVLHEAKRNKYLTNKGYKILYIWESDIKESRELCYKLIKHFIDNSGNIANYNSFNYHMENSVLLLNNNTIKSEIEKVII